MDKTKQCAVICCRTWRLGEVTKVGQNGTARTIYGGGGGGSSEMRTLRILPPPPSPSIV